MHTEASAACYGHWL